MTRTDQTSVRIQVNADWYLQELKKRHAELLQLRDEVEQLSCETQRVESNLAPGRRDKSQASE
jgi:hypothetical protein